jgi:hypothetical protein
MLDEPCLQYVFSVLRQGFDRRLAFIQFQIIQTGKRRQDPRIDYKNGLFGPINIKSKWNSLIINLFTLGKRFAEFHFHKQSDLTAHYLVFHCFIGPAVLNNVNWSISAANYSWSQERCIIEVTYRHLLSYLQVAKSIMSTILTTYVLLNVVLTKHLSKQETTVATLFYYLANWTFFPNQMLAASHLCQMKTFRLQTDCHETAWFKVLCV